MSTTYRPGDVANGHFLGVDNVWHPVLPATSWRRPSTWRRGHWATAAVAIIAALTVAGAVLPDSTPEPREAYPGQCEDLLRGVDMKDVSLQTRAEAVARAVEISC